MAIRWLLDTYLSLLSRNSSNLVIVPVMVSYDRLYEANNLAMEMVDGKRTDYTLKTALSKMYN